MDINQFEPIIISDTDKKSSEFLMTINTDKEQLNHVFGLMKPTPVLPFISWNNITKIYRDFSYDTEEKWINPYKDTIEIKFKRWSYVAKEEADYGNAKIQRDDESGKLIVLIQLYVGKQSYQIDYITSEISKSIGGLELSDIVERNIISIQSTFWLQMP